MAQYSEEQLRRQALDRLIRDEVLAQATKDLGIVVNDASVRDFIQSLEYFQTNGQFDKAKLDSARITACSKSGSIRCFVAAV